MALKVCKDAKKKTIRPSKAGRRRAFVLIGVHVVVAVHVGLWLAMGRTVSPVEPSESMQTLEQGLVNAGFVFFALALLSTAIFGRFFCGWACHIVALQDLCRWLMLKARIRPRPFRVRLLAWVPLGLALYMFVWPNFKRFVVFPALAAMDARVPEWLTPAPMPMGIDTAFIVDDFWATFPTWIVAIPFFLVVGFAAVYFLGTKGFCTYGCPYGGFFRPLDRVSPVRIRVTDACEGCGHCTAVCSSNVRVHEEVRDYGMVVDPGCMKCLDCVSVCPNDALFVGLGAPALFAKPRGADARETRRHAKERRRRTLDATLGEEIVILAVFLIMFVGYRGMFGQVPMLMAVGMAGVGAFGVWMTIRLVRDRNARLHKTQLKRDGRWRPAGVVLVAATVFALSGALWSGAVHYERWRAGILYARVRVPSSVALAPGFAPAPSDIENATASLARYARADAPSHGGFGWNLSPDELLRVAFLEIVRGDLDAAVAATGAVIEHGDPPASLVLEYAQLMHAAGAGEAEITAMLTAALERDGRLQAVRALIARGAVASGGGPEAAEKVWDAASGSVREDPGYWTARARFALELGSRSRAANALENAAARLERGDAGAAGWVEVAEMALMTGDSERAAGFIDRAQEQPSRDPGVRLRIAAVLLQIGRTADGRVWLEDAVEHTQTPVGVLITAAQMHAKLGEIEAAEALMERAAARAEQSPWELVQVGGTLASMGRGLDRADLTDRGIALVERAAGLKPDAPGLAAQVANLYANLGRLPEAAAAMDRAARFGPSSQTLAQQAAELYEHAGDAERAASWRAEALQRAGTGPQP